jgi:hypothetical protein
MTLVSNNPSWWPLINANLVSSYFVAASSAWLMYDWGLTFGQEVELVWRQRWSPMTFLYLSVRYTGIGYAVMSILLWVPTIPISDTGCNIMYEALVWTNEAVNLILGIIIIARLHAMYRRSKKL